MSGDSELPFAGSRGRLLVGLGVGTLVASLLWAVIGPNTPTLRSPSPDGYSLSAIGHQALVALLEELRIPVQRVRFGTAKRAAGASLLVVAEPELSGAAERDLLREYTAVAAPLLLVLPKWSASRAADQPEFADRVWPAGPDATDDLMSVAGITGRTLMAEAARCRGDFIMNVELRDVQLIAGSSLEPVVSCGDGVLVGRIVGRDHTQMVLSDPDVMATHGLRGGGAQLMIALINRLRKGDGPVLFDEVLHGHKQVPSVYAEAMAFPLLLVTAQALLLVGLSLWSSVGRFGAPAPAPRFGGGGRSALIDNEVRLLTSGRDAVASALRYRDMTFRHVRDRYGAPNELPPGGAAEWLQELSRRRGASASFDAMRKRTHLLQRHAATRLRVGKREVLGAVDAITTWKEELHHG